MVIFSEKQTLFYTSILIMSAGKAHERKKAFILSYQSLVSKILYSIFY